MPHRPRPAAGHPVGRGIARLQDLQCRDQLAFKKRPPPPFKGQGRQGRDHRYIAAPRAEETLQPPDRGDDIAIHAIAAFNRRQLARIARHHLPPQSHPLIRGGDGQVILGRAGKFGLVAVTLDHAGQKTHMAEGAVDHRRRNPPRRRPRPEPGDPGVKGRIRLCPEHRRGPARTAAAAAAADTGRQTRQRHHPQNRPTPRNHPAPTSFCFISAQISHGGAGV